MEWQPIETAPKDGRFLLFYRVEHGETAKLPIIEAGGWGVEGWAVFSMRGSWRNIRPTHWMPLPVVPK